MSERRAKGAGDCGEVVGEWAGWIWDPSNHIRSRDHFLTMIDQRHQTGLPASSIGFTTYYKPFSTKSQKSFLT